jgi:hypothetical protein
MHESVMWPIHGRYECRTCGRSYPVLWDAPAAPEPATPAPRRSLRRLAWLLVIGAAVIFAAWPVRAAEALENNPAAIAFARYLGAGPETAAPWRLETVEIEASLPGLSKSGHLRAIRSLPPDGRPEYQVVEISGDKTVKQQVIFRYLRAEAQTSEVAASSIAVTPANYKFKYKGPVADGGLLAYAFQITPRRKREGLVKGELWVEGETGAPIRQSGYLIKSPSMFVKRIDITREVSLRKGVVEARITHLFVDTRLAGRAELLIEERPIGVENTY